MNYPLLSQALLSGASPQLRNIATTGGNLLQRTRCYYFTDVNFPACNKRTPGSGCAAIQGYNRIHAILGQTDKDSTSGKSCIATHPSDMCVALAALNATVDVDGPKGKRTIPFADLHKLSGNTPWIETSLRPGELIVSMSLPPAKFAKNSFYLKVRDRNSYAFALISVAAGLERDRNTVRSVGIALGGVALKPWRQIAAEHVLEGKPATHDSFKQAAEILLRGAKGYEHNQFKIELAKQAIVRALTVASRGLPEQIMMQRRDGTPKQAKQLDHRYEGIAKVTGKIKYAAEFSNHSQRQSFCMPTWFSRRFPAGLSFQSIKQAAEKATGILAILTPFNAPKINPAPPQPPARRTLSLLQD